MDVASEGKLRKSSQGIVGDNLEAEYVPMSFSLKDGNEEIRLTPYAYIPNLWEKMEQLLNDNERYGKTVYIITQTTIQDNSN